MSATTAQIERLRRMVSEPTPDTYTDIDIAGYIERYPVMDELGNDPYTWSGTEPPTQVTNPGWIETYDLNAAASEIWDEKAALVYAQHDFSADGGNYAVSQIYEHCMKMSKHYRSKATLKSVRLIKSPPETQSKSNAPWIANLPESTDPDGDDIDYINF